ncbi:MAG TPA: helix-turn-helix domain-containing protein [Thermomicrobiales bacterium]|jgi:DNA-binding HxlR family transcriptional regulator|nr:helix-turn-helix domain-containing protein [Thermomicrobiales bacterium]
MASHEFPSSFCPVYHQAVELIGRRWTGAILRSMLAGSTRFSDITASIPSLSDRLLSERLKELEQHGIVTRTVIPQTPVRIEYRLTEKGEALSGVVEAISEWGERWLSPAHRDHTDELVDRVIEVESPGAVPAD